MPTLTHESRPAEVPLLDYSDFSLSELLTMEQSGAMLGGRDKASMRRLSQMYGIAGRFMGRFLVHRVAIRLLLEGEMEGLDAFRRGDFADPRVLAAFATEGLRPPSAKHGEAA